MAQILNFSHVDIFRYNCSSHKTNLYSGKHSENIYSSHLWTSKFSWLQRMDPSCLAVCSPSHGTNCFSQKIIFLRWDFTRLERIWEKKQPHFAQTPAFARNAKFHLLRIDCIPLIFLKNPHHSRSNRSRHLMTLNSRDDGCRRCRTVSPGLINAPEG